MFFVNHNESLNDRTNKVIEEYERTDGEVISYLAFYSYEKKIDTEKVFSQTRSSSEEVCFSIPDLLNLLDTNKTIVQAIEILRDEFTEQLQLLSDDEFSLKWFIPDDTIPKITKYLKEFYNV